MLTSIGLEQLLVLLAESRSFKVEQLSEVQCYLVNRLADIKAQRGISQQVLRMFPKRR